MYVLLSALFKKDTAPSDSFKFLSLFYLPVFIVFILLLTGCFNKQHGEHITETRLLLDTYCTITIHGDVDSELLDEAFALCAQLEALFSITIEGSDIWRINHAGGDTIEVDSRTIEVIKAGLEFNKMSDGMFDIAIGRLTRLWNFGGENQYIPTESELTEAMQPSDFSSIFLDGDEQILSEVMSGNFSHVRITDNMVSIIAPDGIGLRAWLDLGAIAKGFIADEIAKFLIARGAKGAMIDLGGDVVTVGNRHDGNPWRIALRKPFGDISDWIGVIEVSDAAVVSSGTYERQFEKDGVNYHHILDPFTGMPVRTDVVSAAVIADSAMVGEGLSTIAVLVGSNGISEIFAKTPGFIGAVLVLESGEILKFFDVEFMQFNDS